MVQLVEDRDLCALGAAEVGRRIASGRASAVDVLDAQLARIDDRNGALGAVVSLDPDGARQRALAADDALATGRPIGPLHGVPITLKDGNDVAGLRTTIGNHELDSVPAKDGAVAARLRAAGANIIGHTNVAAWLADHQSANPVFGRTSNPWDLSRTSGGSSGGAAAALASGMTPLDVGSDLVGSLRQPASFCGVYALKTTEHRVPLTGFFRTPDGAPRPLRIMLNLGPLARWPAGPLHLGPRARWPAEPRPAGPLARDLDDLELALSVISGPDEFDGDVPPVPLTHRDPRPPGDLRVAVASTIPGAPVAKVLQDRVDQVAGAISDAGGQVQEALPEISWQEQGELFGELVQLLTSVFTPDGADFRLARYLELLSRRDELIGCWERFFAQYDALLIPPAATVAYPHCPPGEPLSVVGGQIAYYEQGFVFAAASLNGLPAW